MQDGIEIMEGGIVGLGKRSRRAKGAGSLSNITADDSLGTFGGTATRVIDKESGKAVRRRRRRKRLGVFFAVALVLTVAGAAAATAASAYISTIESAMSYDEEELSELESVLVDTDYVEEAEPYYILILGSDSRTSDTSGTRSDTIILARIDQANSTVHLISIPRDTMVYIEGYGTQKINAAYAWGGASLAVEVISEFAGVDISEVVEVSFQAVIDIVDALGGVEVDVEEDVSYNGISVSAGLQVLTGEEALTYARDRKHVSGGDFGRAAHQRQVLEAIVETVLDSSVTVLPSLVSTLAEYVTTTYTVDEIVDLAYAFYGEEITFYSATCPSYSYSEDGISYVATMFDEWAEMMQRVDAGLDPEGDDEIPEEQLNNSRLGAATNSAGPTNYEYYAAIAGLTTDDVADSDDDDE